MVDSTGSCSADLQIRNIIDTAMDGIISMNEEQKIVLFNAAAEEIFGYHAEQVLSQPIEMLIPSRFRPQHRHDVGQFGRGVIQSRRMGTQRTVMGLRAWAKSVPLRRRSHSLLST